MRSPAFVWAAIVFGCPRFFLIWRFEISNNNYLCVSPTLSVFVMIFVNGLCLFFFARSNLSQAYFIIIVDCSVCCFDDFGAYFEAYFLSNVFGVRKFHPRFHPSDGYRVCPCCRLSLWLFFSSCLSMRGRNLVDRSCVRWSILLNHSVSYSMIFFHG